jgi:ubiquitin-conjugating enzyme E2 R
VDLEDESNLFNWTVYIEGPSQTPYEGGIFKTTLKFPQNYPYYPPEFKFSSLFFHPNVYKDGKVCISILHPPGEDPMSGERPEERWLPIHSVESILISVGCLLVEPSGTPANVDANIEMRKEPETYKKRIQALVERSKKENAHIVFAKPSKPKQIVPQIDAMDFFDEDVYEQEGASDDEIHTDDLILSDDETVETS